MYAVAREMKSIFYHLYKLHFDIWVFILKFTATDFTSRPDTPKTFVPSLVFFILFFEESLTKCETSSGHILFLETG